MQPLTRYQSRQIDLLAVSEYGLASLDLMENAGAGIARLLEELHDDQQPTTAVILCGKGNNGGDGLVLARHLHASGFEVQTILCSEPRQLSPDAAANLSRLQATGQHVRWLADTADVTGLENLLAACQPASWYVDALLGSGATGDPRSPFDLAIRWLNHQAGLRLSIDLPSGLDCDTGLAGSPSVRADHTCTLVAPKAGLLVEAARELVGKLAIVAIGLPAELVARVRRLPATE
jgi:NAD(P)H-hydrate epimerase